MIPNPSSIGDDAPPQLVDDTAHSLEGEGDEPHLQVVRPLVQPTPKQPPRVATLNEFLREGFASLAALRAAPLSNRIIATKVFEMLTGMLRREVGTDKLEEGMGTFLHQLWGGGVELRLFTGLYYRMRAELAAEERLVADAPEMAMRNAIEDCMNVLRWYGKRRVSLMVLADEAPAAADEDALFGVRVLHERRSPLGARGFEVVTGVRLSGKADVDHWLKVQLKQGKKAVRTQSSYIDKPGYWLSQLPKEAKLSGVVPITPQSQRCIIDEVRVFIPYAALPLAPGTHQVEVTVSVFKRGEDAFLTRSLPHPFFMPADIVPDSDIAPSPQLEGIWECDPARGDTITQLEIREELADRYVATCAVTLFDRDGQSIAVQCIPCMADGWEGMKEGIVAPQVTLEPRSAIARYEDVTVTIPREHMVEGAPVRWKAIVVDEMGRTVVGTSCRPRTSIDRLREPISEL